MPTSHNKVRTQDAYTGHTITPQKRACGVIPGTWNLSTLERNSPLVDEGRPLFRSSSGSLASAACTAEDHARRVISCKCRLFMTKREHRNTPWPYSHPPKKHTCGVTHTTPYSGLETNSSRMDEGRPLFRSTLCHLPHLTALIKIGLPLPCPRRALMTRDRVHRFCGF